MGTYRKKLQGTAQYTSFIPAPLSTVHVEEELLAPSSLRLRKPSTF